MKGPLLAQAAEDELSTIQGLEFPVLPPGVVLGIVALVELGLRHPAVGEGMRSVGEAFVRDMRRSFAGYPAVQAIIDQGAE